MLTFNDANKITICSKYSGWNEIIDGYVNLYVNCINNSNQEEEITCFKKMELNF